MIKFLSNLGYTVLIIILFIIGGLLLFSAIPNSSYQTKIVLSGSMEPAIKTGSLIFIKSHDSYEIGDVVTFGEDNQEAIPTTHRIIDTRIVDGEERFITKGDANDDLDAGEISEADIIGKVVFNIPYLGFVLDTAKKPIGFAVLIGVPALVIVYDEVVKIWVEVKKMRKKKVVLDEKESDD